MMFQCPVCGSQWVVVHFYHREFFRCKIVDKHLRIIAQKHLSCKWLCLDAEKAPFFVAKLAIQMLPSVIVFKDGIVSDQAKVGICLPGRGQGAPPRPRV